MGMGNILMLRPSRRILNSRSSCPGLSRASTPLSSLSRTWMAGTSPAMTKTENLRLSVFLLRLDLLDRAARSAPRGKAATEMRHRRKTHVLRGLGGQRRAPAGRALKYELLVFLKHRLGVGTFRIDPEFQHAARTVKRTGDAALALDLARVAQIDDHHIGEAHAAIGKPLHRLGGIDGLDLGVGLVEQFLVTAGDGGRHWLALSLNN